MAANAGAGRDRTPDLTRPDNPLPRRPDPHATVSDIVPPSPVEAPQPPVAPPPSAPTPGTGSRNWHRWHYPVGVFLTAYGVTVLASTAIGLGDKKEWLGSYFGAGMALPALAAVKVVELLLVVVTVSGLVRRRDVWFLPVLAGWAAGFGVFAVLDVVKGKWLALLEHGLYLGGFLLLLFLTYGLSVKARVGNRAPAPAPTPAPEAPAPGSAGLTRTQEFALAALNRWQRAQQQRPPQGPPQGPPPA